MEVEKQHLVFIAGLQDSKQEDERIGENLNSTLNSDKLQDLEKVWVLSGSASDSGLDEDDARDWNSSTEPTFHSTSYIKKRAEKINAKRE